MSESPQTTDGSGDNQSKPKPPWWRSTAGIVIGVIGLVASSSSVYALVDGWLNPSPSIGEVLEAVSDDSQQVNQVSKRVDEFGDQYRRMTKHIKDLRRVSAPPKKTAPGPKIETPAQKNRAEAMAKKETEELVALVDKTETMAKAFVASVEDDATLESLVKGKEASPMKARIKGQVKTLQDDVLPKLQQLRERHGE